MLKMMIHLLTVAALFAMTEDPHAATPRLTIPGDSITIVASGERSTYPLTALKQNDTLRVWDITSLQLLSSADSITVSKTASHIPVIFELRDSLLYLTIWFASTYDRYLEKVALLQEYQQFGSSPTADLPAFTYATADDPDLARIRETYHLDSIAGPGSQIDRMINLMRWVHTAVRHDGNSTPPNPRNTFHLLQVCADSGRGLNCRMMSTILNEAYLATGFKARHLTCLPQDTTDPDCHVTNMVWCDSLGKWLYMDPTNNAWFMNPLGEILSPAEIRAAMIAGDSLVLNPDADYNGSPVDPVQYKGYMAKNLFRFSVPVESAFNYESRDGDRAWIELYPVGYEPHRIGTADTTSRAAGLSITHFTDNSAWFWER